MKASSPLEKSVKRPKVIVDRIMRRVLRKRRSGKMIAFMVYRILQSMGKQADRPCSARFRNTKVKWYALGIADRRILFELQRRLRAAHYTCKICELVCEKMRLPSLQVLTYN